MTIQIPDDIARSLAEAAAAQKKTLQEVAIERLRSRIEAETSPVTVLRTVRKLRHPSRAAVDELEAAIAAARLPVIDRGAFDRSSRG